MTTRMTQSFTTTPAGRHAVNGLALMAALLMLCACRRSPVSAPADIQPGASPEVKTATAITTVTASTDVLTPMPAGVATVTLPPTPTATQEVCSWSYFFRPAPGSCPAGEAVTGPAAEQPFENGVMIWLGATHSVYVLTNDQRWLRFDDSWAEDQPESDPAIIPPDNRYQPIRGFGKVWREHEEVRRRLGWALGPELGFESTLQEQARVEEAPQVMFVRMFNDQVVALTIREPDEGDWVIAAS